jgi:hypothetical protein
MKNIILSIVMCVFACTILSINGMDYAYTQATHEDVSSVLQLMNTHACNDSDKVVIVPKAFRECYVQSAVSAGKLFVAKHGDQVIGYKKFFCITDPKELNDILVDELRCNGIPTVCGAVSDREYNHVQSISPTAITDLSAKQVTYIYTGADFTHPAHRGKNVNAALMDYALAVTSQSVIDHSKQHVSTHLAMVYGLTEGNAGQRDNVLAGRTRGILSHYVPYAQSIANALGAQSPTQFILSRYRAFKPSFDPESTECVPLPDDQSVPGYGCVIACALEHNGGN